MAEKELSKEEEQKELVKSLWVELDNKVQNLGEVNTTEVDECLEKLKGNKEFLSEAAVLPTTKYLVFLGKRENKENLKVIGFCPLPKKIALLKDIRKIGTDEAQKEWKRLYKEYEKRDYKKVIWAILIVAFLFGIFLFGVYQGITWNPRNQ